MILMLKIVSALNGSSVRQSLTILGIELQLQLKEYYFSTQKKMCISNTAANNRVPSQ